MDSFLSVETLMEIIGWAAGLVGGIAAFPQTSKIIKTKQVDDLSIYTFISFFFSVFLWGIYGFYIKAYPMMFFNSLAMILYGVIIYMIIKYRKKK